MMPYCGGDCQIAHWTVHKEVCLKRNLVNVPDIEDLAPAPKAQAPKTEPVDLVEVRKGAKACSCNKCARACKYVPGIYDPAHVLLLQQVWQSQKKDPTEFWKPFVEDYLLESDTVKKSVFYLRPPTTEEKAGGQAPFIGALGHCVNLTSTGCGLSRPEMPLGCVTTLNCDEANSPYDKSKAASTWGGPLGEKVITLYREAAFRGMRLTGPFAQKLDEVVTFVVFGERARGMMKSTVSIRQCLAQAEELGESERRELERGERRLRALLKNTHGKMWARITDRMKQLMASGRNIFDGANYEDLLVPAHS